MFVEMLFSFPDHLNTGRAEREVLKMTLSSLALGIHTFKSLRLYVFYTSRGSLQIPVYFSKENNMKQFFYFPIKIMVPFSMILGKTKDVVG